MILILYSLNFMFQITFRQSYQVPEVSRLNNKLMLCSGIGASEADLPYVNQKRNVWKNAFQSISVTQGIYSKINKNRKNKKRTLAFGNEGW